MTPQESRETFLDSLFSTESLDNLKEVGLYEDFVEGHVSVKEIYYQLKEQGI